MMIEIEATLKFAPEAMSRIKRCAERKNVSIPQYLIDAINEFSKEDDTSAAREDTKRIS